MPELWIPSGTGHSDFIVRKSRFIGEARKVNGSEAARNRVKELRQEHSRAGHVAWAYVLGKDAALKGLSDAGEPRGTAGRPIIDPITGGNLTDTLVTVVRYFGGVKLGTGGLTSAYGRSSRGALAAMPRILLIERVRVELDIKYPIYENIIRLTKEANGLVLEEKFESSIALVVNIPISSLEYFRQKVGDAGSGAAGFEVSRNEAEK